MISQIPGFFAPWVVAVAVLILHLVLPARLVTGYARDEDTGAPLTYRLNGVMVFSVSIAIWLVLGYLELISFDWLWEQRWNSALGACTFGLIATLGEVLMAVGLTLALGYPWLILPWLYPLYYIIFLTARERDDDRRCAGKYGALWDEYRKLVPWRIIPRVY